MPIDIERERRNLSPHAEAKLAISLWGAEYGPQRLGCMDWYDSLPESRKNLCREILDDLAGLPRELVRHPAEPPNP